MKRIVSACLEQTQRFETEGDFQAYIQSLEKKKVRYKLVDKQIQSDFTILIKIKREYNKYDIGNYLD